MKHKRILTMVFLMMLALVMAACQAPAATTEEPDVVVTAETGASIHSYMDWLLVPYPRCDTRSNRGHEPILRQRLRCGDQRHRYHTSDCRRRPACRSG